MPTRKCKWFENNNSNVQSSNIYNEKLSRHSTIIMQCQIEKIRDNVQYLIFVFNYCNNHYNHIIIMLLLIVLCRRLPISFWLALHIVVSVTYCGQVCSSANECCLILLRFYFKLKFDKRWFWTRKRYIRNKYNTILL